MSMLRGVLEEGLRPAGAAPAAQRIDSVPATSKARRGPAWRAEGDPGGSGRRVRMTAARPFSSSRMLPGHEWASSSASASGATRDPVCLSYGHTFQAKFSTSRNVPLPFRRRIETGNDVQPVIQVPEPDPSPILLSSARGRHDARSPCGFPRRQAARIPCSLQQRAQQLDLCVLETAGSPISSRNSVPPSAASKPSLPRHRRPR